MTQVTTTWILIIVKTQKYFRYTLQTNKLAYISVLLERPIHGIKAGDNRVRDRALLLRNKTLTYLETDTDRVTNKRKVFAER